MLMLINPTSGCDICVIVKDNQGFVHHIWFTKLSTHSSLFVKRMNKVKYESDANGSRWIWIRISPRNVLFYFMKLHLPCWLLTRVRAP